MKPSERVKEIQKEISKERQERQDRPFERDNDEVRAILRYLDEQSEGKKEYKKFEYDCPTHGNQWCTCPRQKTIEEMLGTQKPWVTRVLKECRNKEKEEKDKDEKKEP